MSRRSTASGCRVAIVAIAFSSIWRCSEFYEFVGVEHAIGLAAEKFTA